MKLLLMAAVPLALAVSPCPAPANTVPISASAAVALVKASPQLTIDPKAPAMGAFDAKTHPFVNVAGLPEGSSIGGYLSPAYAHEGRLADGTTVLAIPLDSGGSGGIFTQIVFTGSSVARLAYAGHIDSAGHLSVTVESGAIVAHFPKYGPNDPNCCPSNYAIVTYGIVDGKLHKLTEKTTPASPHP